MAMAFDEHVPKDAGERDDWVAYLMVADKYLGPLASRLSGVNQPVICTPTAFSTHHLTLVTCIGAYLNRSTPRSSTTPVS
jgi:hypothetical protein